MKVNEVILEAGIWSGIKGAVQGYQQSRALQQDPVVNDAIGQWAAYTKKLTQAGVNLKDPAQYEVALNKWLGVWINGKGAPSYQGQLPDIDNLTVRQYIAQAIAKGKTRTAPAPAQTTAGIPEGYRLEVVSPITGGKYYKTGNQWTNEVGQPVTEPNNIAALNQWADTAGKIKRIMSGPQEIVRRARSRKEKRIR